MCSAGRSAALRRWNPGPAPAPSSNSSLPIPFTTAKNRAPWPPPELQRRKGGGITRPQVRKCFLMADQFDAIVIGGGPGGYNAAIRLGQLGLKAACVDSRGTFGGSCLNIGCIQSKALLHASERYEEAQKEFAKLGI